MNSHFPHHQIRRNFFRWRLLPEPRPGRILKQNGKLCRLSLYKNLIVCTTKVWVKFKTLLRLKDRKSITKTDYFGKESCNFLHYFFQIMLMFRIIKKNTSLFLRKRKLVIKILQTFSNKFSSDVMVQYHWHRGVDFDSLESRESTM